MARRNSKKKVIPKLGYGAGYAQAKPIETQVAILHELFPHLGSVDEYQIPDIVPEGMEGYFAIPHWSIVAPTYVEAMHKAREILNTQRKFFSFHFGKDDSGILRETRKKEQLFDILRTEQSGKKLTIIACQFGARYVNCSVQDVRSQFAEYEFGLGVYEALILLLTHPERLTGSKQLGIFCAGDEYVSDSGGRKFIQAPCITFNDHAPRDMFGENECEYPPEPSCLELTVDLINRPYPELGVLSAQGGPHGSCSKRH